MAAENTLLILLLVLSVGLILPGFFKRFRIPFLSIIIVAGALLGPSGLGYVVQDEIISFLGFLGMTFLMFMAGAETDMRHLPHAKRKIATMAILNGLVPFIVGFIITYLFGYSFVTSTLVGIVFISSSVALIVSSLHENKSISRNVSQLILSAVLITDIVSLIALGIIFQSLDPITALPLHVYFSLLFLSIVGLFMLIPRISEYILKRQLKGEENNEGGLRYIIIVLVATLVFFSYLGAHPVLAAFLAGLALSKPLSDKKTKRIESKIHTLSYGLFIPIFFFIVGMEMDLSLLANLSSSNIIMVSLIGGLVLSKFVSGYIAGKIVGFTSKDSAFYGSISIIQLTTTLAVTYAASSLQILDATLTTTIILISILTTLIGPLLARLFTR